MTIDVVVVDDQDLVRDGFTMIIDSQPDMRVVGTAGDGTEAVDVVRRVSPHVVLMDVRMPGEDGLAATGRLLAQGSTAKVLMLTTFDLDEYVAEALALGASGFLLKDAPRQHLLAGIRRAAADDGLVLAPSVVARLVSSFVERGRRVPDPRLATLSERELEVLRLVADGLSNAEIAARLYLGVTTVKSHVGRILEKTGLRDRIQIVILAHQSGLAG